jgi:bacterioferritin-associated ferredoxin
MNLDDEICYCFHISRRKLVNFARRGLPQVPSQMSECGGAGTGCGWCIPFLKQIFGQEVRGEAATELGDMTPTGYAQKRAEYVRAGGGTPPPGATPLPENSGP